MHYPCPEIHLLNPNYQSKTDASKKLARATTSTTAKSNVAKASVKKTIAFLKVKNSQENQQFEPEVSNWVLERLDKIPLCFSVDYEYTVQ